MQTSLVGVGGWTVRHHLMSSYLLREQANPGKDRMFAHGHEDKAFVSLALIFYLCSESHRYVAWFIQLQWPEVFYF